MTIGPAHQYLLEGLELGYSKRVIEKILSSSFEKVSKNLTYIHSLKHLSHITGVHYVFLREVVERRVFPYETYSVKKKDSNYREITAPNDELKLIQRWISENILINIKPHYRCFSYHKDASILKCAQEHLGAKWLIKLDIKNFFGSIQEGQVYEVFESRGYEPLVSFEMTRLCTVESDFDSTKNMEHWIKYKKYKKNNPYDSSDIKTFGSLPQGAPTSPHLSNVIFKPVDVKLQKLACDNSLIYTRYSDDISFSSSDKEFTRELSLNIIKSVSEILKLNHYMLNLKKTVIVPPSKSKSILGLNVDGEVARLSKDYKKRLEFHVNGVNKFGLVEHARFRRFKTVFGMIMYIRGVLSFSKSIDLEYGRKIEEIFESVLQREGLL